MGINDSTKYDFDVVKNVKLSDSGLFKCGPGRSNHSYIAMFQVVGKLLLTYLFSAAVIKMCSLVYGHFQNLEWYVKYPKTEEYLNLCTVQ